MEVISSVDARELTLTLRGELDHHGAKEVMQRLEWELDSALPVKLTLDFSGVTFMDSSGVGLILGRGRHIRALGGRLTVQNPPAAIRRMLDLARIAYA